MLAPLHMGKPFHAKDRKFTRNSKWQEIKEFQHPTADRCNCLGTRILYMPVLGTCFQELGPSKTSKEHLLSGSFMLSQNQDEIANSSAAINLLSA